MTQSGAHLAGKFLLGVDVDTSVHGTAFELLEKDVASADEAGREGFPVAREHRRSRRLEVRAEVAPCRTNSIGNFVEVLLPFLLSRLDIHG